MSLVQLPLLEAPFAFVDVETTGLRPELGHRVVEIAVLQTEGAREVSRFSALIDPRRPLDPGAMRVNGITPDMVADAPVFADVLPDLQARLQDRIIVAHNAPFDMGFLQTEWDIAGAAFEPGPILDTLMLARRQYYFHSNSLGNIARALNIAAPNAHRALADVLTTCAIFERFCGDLARRNRPLVNDWLRMQGGIPWTPPPPPLDDDHPLQIALAQQCTVVIEYRSGSGRVTRRLIQPLTCSGNFLVAYCHLRQEQRT
ncbi:MAG: exonuclease domain-containing protein, partial [Anaerolineae bacterium]